MTDPGATPDPEPSPSIDPFHGPDWDDEDDDSPDAGPIAEAGSPGAASRGKRRRVSRRRLRRRRRIGLVMIGVGGLVVLTGLWIIVTALLARSQLQQARDDVRTLRTQITTGDLAAARATAHDLQGHADKARFLSSGPAWATVAALPGGQPLQTVRGITAQIHALAHDVLPQLVDASREFEPSALRNADGSIDVTRLQRAEPILDSAAATVTTVTARLRDQPAHTWIGAVDTARSGLLTQLSDLGHVLKSADTAAKVVPTLLGADGTRRYFVAFQNEAELRGTGGLPGAFAILRADHGVVTFERFESDRTLQGVSVDVDLGSDYDALFAGARTESDYRNTNLSPHFPYAAKLWMAMWQKRSGQHLDGAMAVDPTALSYLLKVTGPATLADGTTVTAANVVDLTQRAVYAKYPDPNAREQAERQAYLLRIAKAATSRVIGSRASPTALVKAGAKAAAQRRLLVYSADQSVERRLEGTPLSGALPTGDAPFVGLSIVNLGGNKLDYYLDRSITWKRTGCGPVRTVDVTIKLTNKAPANLGRYQTARSDRPAYRIEPGDNRLLVSYYASTGAVLRYSTLDGATSTPYRHRDLGHPVFNTDVELPRGATRTIVLHLSEQPDPGSPEVLRQPGVRPLTVKIDDARC